VKPRPPAARRVLPGNDLRDLVHYTFAAATKDSHFRDIAEMALRVIGMDGAVSGAGPALPSCARSPQSTRSSLLPRRRNRPQSSHGGSRLRSCRSRTASVSRRARHSRCPRDSRCASRFCSASCRRN
jgi:hypothetical protein